MTERREIDAAYYQGLHEMHGADPEVAADLGIPTSPEEFEQHMRSGQEVARALSAAQTLAEGDTPDAGPYIPLGTSGSDASRIIANAANTYEAVTPERRVANAAGKAAAKSHILPLPDRP